MDNLKDVIFDKNGKPSLRIVRDEYLAPCERKFYAGYIEKGRAYDFNGNQRGWLDSDGVLRDLNGRCVGFLSSANGTCHPVFPKTKQPTKDFAALPEPPLKPVSLEDTGFELEPKKEWADKNPVGLMIP